MFESVKQDSPKKLDSAMGTVIMRILVADDDELYRHAIEKALKQWGFEVVIATEGNMALQILQGPDPPRIAILDWMMPNLNGIDVCSRLRSSKNETYIYIVLITAKKQMEDVVAGLSAEADDYLIKPFNFQELRVRLQAGVRVINLQAALASKQRELAYLATHDSLTDLLNRHGILGIAARELDRGNRESRLLWLAMVDIDHFKEINDELGHAAGDTILCEAAQRMRSALRSYDLIGRYGGDEFLLVMLDLDKRMVIKLAERLRNQVGEKPYNVMDRQIDVSISMGVASNNGAALMENLIHSADIALYRAKAAGRNRIEFAEAETEPMERQLLTGPRDLAQIEKTHDYLQSTPNICAP
jgi:two-component system, cell cycle response regulator